VNGAVYAGTGSGGLVLKSEPGKDPAVFFRSGELAVHALARDGAGNLYVGTSPNGRVFRVTPAGQSTELLSMNGQQAAADAGGKFVLSLAVGEDGTVFAGTGPEGRIYRLRAGQPAQELCKLPVKSVMSLLVGPGGTLYAGTAEEGSIYKIEMTEGAPRVGIAYDTDQTTVSGLAMDRAGNLYAACAPSGQIYRISADGSPRVHFDAPTALYGLLIDAGGNLYSCSGNSILRVEPDGTATVLSEKKNTQFISLSWDDHGRMVAGSANMGCVYRLGPATSGTFESTVHDAKVPARWGRMRYTGMLPDGGTLTVQTRTGNTPEPDNAWTAWENPISKDGSSYVASPSARFIQYRVLFQAEKGGAPALRDMTISYLPRNQAPKLTLATPVGSEVWKGTQTLKWSAADPNSDTLTYELSYSADSGKTWKPVGEKGVASAAAPAPAPAADGRPNRQGADEALARFKKDLDADSALTPQQRDEKYEKAKALIDKFFADDPQAAAAPAAPRPAAPVPASLSRTPGVTRQATYAWDTTQVPDGIYVLRVVATDRASNPGEPLSDTKISEPFIVSNTPPQLFVFERGITVDSSRNASVLGFVTGRVTLKGAQYRVGTGEWLAIDPEDGIWDSAFEHFRFSAAAAGSGEQTVEVKVVDTAGNVRTSKVKFQAPQGG
jgi:sugar lactone lactonase YvrE